MQPKTYARAAVVILTGLNLVNYIDRYVLFGVQPLVQHEFNISDTKFGLLTTAFFICYMCAAPFVGVVADRYPRKPIVFIGAIVWSAATLLTAITYNYDELFLRHLIVGIGEATFVTIAPALISDMFPEEQRVRALSIFYIAMPVGAALGYQIGGYFGTRYGWRHPFYIAAAPGVLLAIAFLFIPEPKRGGADHLRPTYERSSILGLFRNKAYWTATLGMAMLTYTIGGLSAWMPTFLSRVRGVELGKANEIFGSITIFSGLVATVLGGWLGARLIRRTKGAYYLVSGVGMALAVPFIVLAIYHRGTFMYPAMLLGVFLVLLNTSPLNAALVNSVAAPIRATAVAVNLFMIHLLGDAPSPAIIGWISHHSNLQTGFLSTIVAAAISAVILLYGMRFAPDITANEQAQSKAGVHG